MRHGPKVTVCLVYDCGGCEYSRSESYAIQGDSGVTLYCAEPAMSENKKRHIGEIGCGTPEWCPFRN